MASSHQTNSRSASRTFKEYLKKTPWERPFSMNEQELGTFINSAPRYALRLIGCLLSDREFGKFFQEYPAKHSSRDRSRAMAIILAQTMSGESDPAPGVIAQSLVQFVHIVIIVREMVEYDRLLVDQEGLAHDACKKMTLTAAAARRLAREQIESSDMLVCLI